MEIKTSSWHYRFLQWMHCQPPQTLCTYFWSVVGMMILFVAMWSIAGLIVFALSAPIWGLIAMLVNSEFSYRGLPLAMLMLEIGVCIITGVAYGYDKAKETSFVHVTGKYLKAKKDKVCPLITYKGEE